MTEETISSAEQIPRKPRSIVPAAHAQQMIVEATIELLRELPFDQVTSKLISEKVNLTAPTIWRNFGSMEGLLTYVASVLMKNAVERWQVQSSLPTITVLFDPDVILRTKLVAWLVGEGANPQLFSSPLLAELIKGFQQGMPEVTKRSATTWMHLNTSLLQGAVLFGGVNAMTDEIMADSVALMVALQDQLPRAAKELGWND